MPRKEQVGRGERREGDVKKEFGEGGREGC